MRRGSNLHKASRWSQFMFQEVAVIRERPLHMGAVGLFAVLAVLPWLLPPSVDAAHPRSPNIHLSQMHLSSSGHGAYDEDYCVDDITAGGQIGDAAALDRVRDALILSSPYKWDLIGSGRIDLYTTVYSCSYYYPGDCTAQVSGVEINYCIKEDWNQACGTGSSCVAHYAWDGNHYGYAVVRMVLSHVTTANDEHRRNINHETGHVFGLCDPENQYWVDCDPEQANTAWAGLFCTSLSVMHQYTTYGCSSSLRVLTPQLDDVNNVVAQMNTYP